MPKKNPKFVKIPWRKFSNKFLESLANLNFRDEWEKVEENILERTRKVLSLSDCDIKLTRRKFINELSNREIKRNIPPENVWTRLPAEEKEAFKKTYPEGSSEAVRASISKTHPNADKMTICYLV